MSQFGIAQQPTPYNDYNYRYTPSSSSYAQVPAYPEVDSMVCVSNRVGIYDVPGATGRYLSSVYFGDQVRKVPNSRTIRFNGKNFIEVATRGGMTGWTEADLFVEGGGVVTLLEDKQIHQSPSATSVTTDYFRAGELYVLSDFDGSNWVELMTREKTAIGWVKGIDEISFSEEHIRFATLIHQARQITDVMEQKRELEKIRRLPGFNQSGFSPIVQRMLAGYVDGDIVYIDDQPEGGVYYDDNVVSTPFPRSEPEAEVVVEKVIDMETGRYYNRVRETGTIAEVDGPKRPQSIYWAYHKTRPINSQILLHLPEGGYVQVQVVARLRQDNPAAIGLGKKLLEAVYGTRHAKWATFSYPQ